MKNIDTVVFDLDGTLLDTIEDLKDSCNNTMRHFGYPEHTVSEVKRFVGNGIARMIELAIPGGKDCPDYEKAVEFAKEDYARNPKLKTRPYAGIPEAVAKICAAGIKAAIVSNKPDGQVKELRNLYFQSVPLEAAIGETEGVPRKPAPDSVWKVMEILGAQKETTVYVGDSEVDIATARNSQIDCISVTWGFREKELLKEKGAVNFADTAEELADYILKHKK